MEKSSAVFPLMIEFAIVKYLDLKWKSQIFRLHSLFFQHASVHSAKENWHIEFHIMNNVIAVTEREDFDFNETALRVNILIMLDESLSKQV